MSDDIEDIVAMARAAQRDERLSDGPLYGKLADEIERLRANGCARNQGLTLHCGEAVLARDEIERLRADRRERIATACLAGMLANSNYEGSSATFNGCAYDAVLLADALIARLDKEAAP